jgi:hypothetical protein
VIFGFTGHFLPLAISSCFTGFFSASRVFYQHFSATALLPAMAPQFSIIIVRNMNFNFLFHILFRSN